MQSLQGITEVINRIEFYVGFLKIFINYDSNKLIQNGVEHNMEIIGDAVKRLIDLD